MRTRVRRALRFAVATLLAVYAVGLVAELVDVYVMGEVADGWTAAQTLRFNESVWRWIAGGEALAVFLLRLGDVSSTLPPWRFAVLLGVWLGVASVVTGNALEERRWLLAAVCALAAVLVWLMLHRRLPGWPGRVTVGHASGLGEGVAAAPSAERELR
jgi:hypothetical protein